MTQTISKTERVKALSLTMKVSRVRRNPHMQDSDNMDHWRCDIRQGSGWMRVYFSKGYGHHGAQPTLDEVMDCLAMDAAGVDNARTFEEWCREYGYDTDSRKAEKTYNMCKQQRDDLYNLLGPSSYYALLWETERE